MDFTKIAFKGFFKNKRLKLYITSIALTFGMIISVIYSMYLLNNVLDEKINNNIVNRVIAIGRNNGFSNMDLKNIMTLDNVKVAYNRLSNVQVKLNNDNNILLSYVTIDEIPRVTYGTTFEVIDELQIILPSKTYDNEGKLKDNKNYVGKSISVIYEDLNLKAKVIGIYESKYGGGSAYINEYFKNELVSYNEKIIYNGSSYVVIDEYKNVDNVIKTVEEKYNCSAYIPDTSGKRDVQLYKIATIIEVSILILTVIFIYIVISIIVGNIISDEKTDIAILKAIGYKVKDLYTIIKYRIFSIMVISFIISCIIAMTLNRLIAFIIDYKLDIKLQSKFSLFIVTLVFFITCVYIISIVSIKLNNRKIKKINAIELLKET